MGVIVTSPIKPELAESDTSKLAGALTTISPIRSVPETEKLCVDEGVPTVVEKGTKILE
jgi:hypothetical protein